MTLVVGYAPDWRGRAVLHLAGMLARSAQDDLVVCAVVPSPLPPRPAQVDSEHRRFLDGVAQAALERARERLPGDVAAASQVHHASSAPAGLLEVTERRKAAMIVVGTSGHPAIGSVTARLLHGSPVPVALAPHRFRSGAGATDGAGDASRSRRRSSSLLTDWPGGGMTHPLIGVGADRGPCPDGSDDISGAGQTL